MVRPELVPNVTLNDGRSIPLVGLGTFQAPKGVAYDVVQWALDAGYRHFDCADFYENEDEIGQSLRDAIKAGKVTREQLFITSKVWPNWYAAGRPTRSAQRTINNLGLDYVDLLLVHWPTPLKQVDDDWYPGQPGQCLFDETISLVDVWKEFEEIKKKGMAKSIGVSNFNSQQIDLLINNSSTVPVTNQVECHPFLSQEKLKEFCAKRKIVLTAYSPLARTGTSEEKNTPSPLEIPLIKDLAKKYNKTPAQICVKWQAQRGVVVIPKSSTKERIYSNIDIFDFDFTEDEMKAINGLNRDLRNNRWSQFGINKHKDWPFGIPF